MKINKFLSVILLVLLAGYSNSCEKISNENEAKGKLEIAVALNEGILKSAGNDSINYPDNDTIPGMNTFQILISVVNRQGLPVMEDELIPLFNFGSGFVSNRIEFNAGEYQLTKFMIINPQGNVVYAAPMAGSAKSYLVLNPLPMEFTINTESITRVVPEVLSVVNENPQEFGYAGFGFQVVKPLTFYVIAMINDPRIMAPTQLTQALLKVITPEGWEHSFRLEARLNVIAVRGGAENYILICEKPGYAPLKLSLSPRELMATSPDNPINLSFGVPDFNVLTLKPGPRAGKDAMISNLSPQRNFGNHIFFEATFITEPVLAVMRSNNSLIWFDTGQLPRSATIRKAELLLFSDQPIPWNYEGGISTASSDRPWYGAVLQQIIEPWDEDSVNWFNQPKTTEANQVYISPFNNYPEGDTIIYSDQNLITEPGTTGMINVDVTSLFVPVEKINLPNYGMFFKLYPAEQFPGFRFASSDHPNLRMHPELRLYYTLP